MIEFLSASQSEIASELKTNLTTGLTQQEAAQRLAREGKNELPPAKLKPWYLIFFLAFTQPLHIVLMIAAVISVVAPRIGHWSDPMHATDFIDFIVIMLIVFLDATLETVQTMRARKSVQALKQLTQPSAIVIRDGRQVEIKASQVVRGDLVVLDAGKFIPADLRFLEVSELHVDESILTGESEPVLKTSNPQETTRSLAGMMNLGFSGTFVTNGRATGVVISTGINTEIGKINEQINENSEEKTPLEKKLTRFSYWLSLVAVILGVIMFVALYFDGEKAKWTEYLMVSITLAIGIIPESLPAVVAIALSVTTKRMAQSNVIVKKLSSVEALGSVNVICTDKTGTLTQNRMTIRSLIWNNEIISSEEFINLKLNKHKDFLLKALVLPNDSITDKNQRLGDPTEVALVDFAELMHVDELASRKRYPRQGEFPFDSERKLMTTINSIDGHEMVFTKGALEEVLKISNRIYLNDSVVSLTAPMRKKILDNSKKLSADALRILAFAYSPKVGSRKNVEHGLIYLGAVAMIDPVRPKAIRTIKAARKAGIRVVMITGDHATTALAIARELDLAQSTNQVLSADELDKMNNRQLTRIIDNIQVFARVNPEDKVKIVQILEKKGNIVAMTGDGVNDGPSLAAANIGVAMGKNGTDVAKDAADVILTDDNFATIMRGVDEGRSVYQKIRQAIVLLIGFNMANVITIFILALLNKQMAPLKAVDILYLNLLVESCLAIAMGMGPVDSSLMKLPPPTGKHGLTSGLWYHIIVIGLSLAATNILAYYIGLWSLPKTSGDARYLRARTMLFISAAFAPLFLAQVIKLTNWKSSKKIPWLISKPLIYAGLLVIVLNSVFIFTPVLNDKVLGLIGYGSTGWNQRSWWLFFVGFALSLVPMIIVLIINAIIFYSYHYRPGKRRRNRQLVTKMISEDKKKSREIKK